MGLKLLVTFIIASIITWIARTYIDSYLKAKGTNLATKEDVEEITRKVEGVKSEVSLKLEVIKWELGKKATVHRLAAEKEFEALIQIGTTLYSLKMSTIGLRPIMDRIDPNEPEIDRHNRRYTEWAKSHDAFMDTVEKHKLFLPSYLYRQFSDIRQLSRKEAIGFETALKFGEGKLNFGAYKDGEKNIDEMNTAIENALVAIRQRYDIEK